MQSGAKRGTASKTAVRSSQMAWRSDSSAATSTPRAPVDRQMARISAMSSWTASGGPSHSTMTAAAGSAGPVVPVAARHASRMSRSITSRHAGTMPAAITSVTAAPAASSEGKSTIAVRTAAGRGSTRSQTVVATPSVPSDPTKTPRRS